MICDRPFFRSSDSPSAFDIAMRLRSLMLDDNHGWKLTEFWLSTGLDHNQIRSGLAYLELDALAYERQEFWWAEPKNL